MKTFVYSVQIEVDGFGNDTWVAFLGDSHESCEKWIKEHYDYINANHWHGIRKYAIVKHKLNEEFNNYFSD